MRTNRRGRIVGPLVAVLLGLAMLAVAAPEHERTHAATTSAYSAVDLGTLGGRNSTAIGVNRRGQVVGWAEVDPSSEEEFHAFLWQAGQMTDLGTLGGRASMAFDINDDGQVVGWAENTAGDRRAVLWQEDTITDLGTLGGRASAASGINVQGQIVGGADIDPSSEDSHAFVWAAGQMTDLGTLGGQTSRALDINDRGHIVGLAENAEDESRAVVWEEGAAIELSERNSYARSLNSLGQVVGTMDVPGGEHALLWDEGAATDLGALGGPNSFGNGIDEAGRIVGAADIAAGGTHAFLWDAGSMTDLGTLGGTGSSATAIGPNGIIVGWADTATGEQRAVLWTSRSTPVSLPATPDRGAQWIPTTLLGGLRVLRRDRSLPAQALRAPSAFNMR